MGPLCHRHRYGNISTRFRVYIFVFSVPASPLFQGFCLGTQSSFEKINNYIANIFPKSFPSYLSFLLFELVKIIDFSKNWKEFVYSSSLSCYWDQALDLLVSVSYTHCCAYTSDLSTLLSARGLTSLRYGIPYLEASFTLRCFQRLSQPHSATLLCRWRDNRCTVGAFIPVLSY